MKLEVESILCDVCDRVLDDPAITCENLEGSALGSCTPDTRGGIYEYEEGRHKHSSRF